MAEYWSITRINSTLLFKSEFKLAMVAYIGLLITKYYLEVLPLTFPLEVFVHPKMGFFSVNKEVFPIGISLCVRIRGTRSDGKLNLIYIFILAYPWIAGDL